jgi:hypothetical protein
MTPSLRVNDLLLRNFLESGIQFDSKSAEESKQILGGINTNASTLLSPRILLLQ